MKNPCAPVLIFFFLFSTCLYVNAQKGWDHTASIGWQTHYGSYLSHSPKADYIKDSYTFFNEWYYQHQTDGSQPWQVANKRPQWGVALFWGGTGSKKYMGHMAGVFPFINIPLLKRKGFSSKLRTGMGLGWVERPYDKETNHKNVLIGSTINGFIQFLWQNELRLAPRLYLNGGFSFSHLSNGGSTLPNLGLNVPALSVGLRYGAAEGGKATARPVFEKAKVQYTLFASAGTKQAPWVESRRYLVNTISAEAGKLLSHSSKLSGGAVFFYDRSLEVHPAGIPSLKRRGNFLQAGIFAAYEHQFGKLSVPLQLGTYVWNKDLSPQLFQNIGLRYRAVPKLSAQLILKTHMGQADHIHFGVGYHF